MIVVVDYGVGNLTSIQNMFKKAGFSTLISDNSDDILSAEKLVLPGMGAFDNCMEKLEASGLRKSLEVKALINKVPVLAICVGLQMFMESSEEGNLPGLGWIQGKTVRFNPALMDSSLKIPNMGWLEVLAAKQSPILENLEGSRFYFAHSYHVTPSSKDDILLSASYGYEFAVGLEHDNLIGVQFHPEKSHRFGLQLLKNFGNNY